MRVVWRILILGALVGLAVPSTAAAQDAEPTPEELEALAAEFDCPALDGMILEGVDARVTPTLSTVTCNYTTDGPGPRSTIGVEWQTAEAQDAYICLRNSFTQDDEQFGNIHGAARVDGFAAQGTFNYYRDEPGPPKSAWESAAAELGAQAGGRAAGCPPAVACTPNVGALAVTFDAEADVFTSDGVWQANCWWSAGDTSDVPSEEYGLWSDVVLNVYFATPGQDNGRVTTVCSAEPFDDLGMVVIPGPDSRALYARIDFRRPALRFPREEMIAEANRLLVELGPISRSCDGVEIVPISDYYTPLPAWLDIDPALAAGGAPIDIDMSGGGDNAPTLSDDGTIVQPTAAAPGGGTDDGSTLQTLLKVFGVVMLIVSVLGVLLSLVMVGKESRLRPRFDVLRVLVMGAVAAVMTLVFAVQTPPWAFGSAALVGLVLGFTQGRNLTVRTTDKGLYAKRTAIAVLAFVAGLVVTQVAGLMSRTGAIQFGLALSVLSVATAIGLILGRQPAVTHARRLGAGTAALMLIAPTLALLTVGGNDQATAQTDDTETEESDPRDIFLDMVEWDTVEIIGGFAASENKPPIELPDLAGLLVPPPDVVAPSVWSEPGASTTISYDIEETFSFSLNAAGVCCDMGYAVAGTTTSDREGSEAVVEKIAGDAAIPDVVIGGASADPMPFGQATIVGDTCSRTIASRADAAAFMQLDAYTVDGNPQGLTMPAPALAIGCEIPGFTVAAALDAAPSTPDADDEARTDVRYGTAGAPGCPVYQEAVAAVYDPAFEQGKLNPGQLGKLFIEPNLAACQGFVDLGGDERGATRSELSFEMATTNPVTEAQRRWNKWDSFLNERPLHEIPIEDRCVLDDGDVPQNPDTTDACVYRSYHEVGEGQITIWVDWSLSDGPNTWVRGYFPWGDYNYRCHHCEPGSPEITRIVDRWNQFGSRGVGGYGAGDLSAAPSDDADGEDGESGVEVDEELIDLFAGEDADDETRAAVAAALAGLLGAAGLAGISMAESATSAADLLSALRSGQLDDLRPDELPTDAEVAALFDDPALAERYAEELRRRQAAAGLAAGGVLDEHGNAIRPGDDGLFGWETPDGTEQLTREEILERIADARAANAARDARHGAIVADHSDEDAIDRRQGEMTQRSVDDDERAAEELADHLAHEAAQDVTRQRVADALQERAETGGWDAIADRLAQGDSLSREEIQAIRDALDRLSAEQGDFDPESTGTYAEDLWNEFAADARTGQEIMAQVAETVYGPVAGWIVRNPGTTARIGLGIATGGFSEGVIAPHEMMAAMEAAAARAHAEGRDLTYGEAMMAAAWHAGPGMLIGKAAELGIAAAGPAIARWGSEALEQMGRSVDEFFDSARHTDIPAPRSVRSSAELADAHGLRWNPDKARGGVRSAEPGTIVPQSRISEDYGMTDDGFRQLRGTVQRNDVTVSVRSRSRGAMDRINGPTGAVPKPAPIKIKTGGELDEFIGMSPSQRDLVPWKPDGDWIPPVKDTPPPNWPSNRTWDDEAYESVLGRYNQRRQEWLDNRGTMDELFSSNQARHNPETGNLEWNTTGGRRADPDDFRPVAGDHDIFDIEVNVPQSVLDMGPEEVERYVRQVQADVLQDLSGPPLNVQHGAHMQWSVPSSRQAQTINVRILNSHRPPAPGQSGDALLRVSRDMPAHIGYYQGASLTLDEVHRIFR